MPRSIVVGAFTYLVLAGLLLVAGAAMAQAQTPKRVLYVSHAAGFAHTSRLYARDVLAQMGQTAGAFTLTWTDDASQVTGATLGSYDAVIFFTSGELPWTPEQKTALLDFVRNGKGFVGVHSATDTFYTWPAYGELVGAYFENHPWTQLATIRVEDTTHPSTAHLGTSFALNDEIYQVRNWTRSSVNVLLSLDTASVPPIGTRPDNDYALAWTKPYGSGRVFYTALGHFEAVWDDPRFRQHMLGAIRWALFDGDADGLDDRWELRFGLSDRSATGVDGASGDSDNDGSTNVQEQAAGTHPRALFKRYLAEGATGSFFDTRMSLLNYHASLPAHVQLRYLKDSGEVAATDLIVPPHSQRAVRVADLPAVAGAAFATVIECDIPCMAERTMTWGGAVPYGSHAEASLANYATNWYFAEGATHGSFDLFFLVQNPTDAPVRLEATFLRGAADTIVREYAVAPNSRLTINVDAIPGLEASDVAAAFRSLGQPQGPPIIVERAMYLSRPGELWSGGHASAGVTSLATRWFLAEGATGSFFDTFVLVGNPGNVDAPLRVTYLKPDGTTVVRQHTVGARRRLTLAPEAEAAELASTSLSVIVESTGAVPIVVERAMWWPGPTGATWHEGHSTLATTDLGFGWALADGEAGGPNSARTYVLVATGQSSTNDSVRLRVLLDDGQVLERTYMNALTGSSRVTFDMESEFPALAGRRFGVIVESLGLLDVGGTITAVTTMPIVVERAVYANAGGVFWAAGTNLVATKLY